MTSSKTSSAPEASQSARSASRKPGSGGTTPMLPATGSTMTAASRAPWASTAARTPSASLNAQTTVSAATPAGTPGEDGIPSVAEPEPAAASSPSAWPW